VFIGHFGAGFAAKGAAKKISLGTLFLAAQFIDLLWPTLLLLGVETVKIEPGATAVTPLNFEHYPISHSLLFVFIWAAAFAVVFFLVRKNTLGALLLGALVVSHWLLDLVVHRPDLPLYPGSAVLGGMDLWSSLTGTLLVEGAIYGAGLYVYFRTTESVDRQGSWGAWGLAAVLVIVYLLNLFGPLPPNVTSIAWAGHLQWLFIIWAYWADRHRRPTIINR
jgi:FtsH-binding integral membrane protein